MRDAILVHHDGCGDNAKGVVKCGHIKAGKVKQLDHFRIGQHRHQIWRSFLPLRDLHQMRMPVARR